MQTDEAYKGTDQAVRKQSLICIIVDCTWHEAVCYTMLLKYTKPLKMTSYYFTRMAVDDNFGKMEMEYCQT